MLLVSYECSRSFAARSVAFASAASTGRAVPGLAVARGAASTSLPAAALTALAGKLSRRFAARLATTTLIGRLSAHVSRLHQAFLIKSDQIQAAGLRERLHH